MKRLILMATAALMLAAGSAALAHPKGPEMGFLEGRKGERIAQELGLDEAQREQIAAVIEGGREEGRALREAIRENRKALEAASEYDQFDANRVAELAAEQGSLHAQRVELMLKTRNAAQAVLTEGQRQQMAEMRERRGERLKRKGARLERMQRRLEAFDD